jgi:RNA-directed DNA polymerase
VNKAKPFCISKREVWEAYKRVKANKGAAGVDGQSISKFEEDLKNNLYKIWNRMSSGSYFPPPVRRVDIPKDNEGTRPLGIPTVLDRFIQQILLQVFTPIFDPTFSFFSYGFRPGRNAHQAVKQAKEYIAEGYEWVVDIDLEKFFDRVNHDILMGRLAKRIEDKRILRLIRRYLQAGIMVHGVVQERWEGTPQGGPISPLLSNLLLDELDKELERRGHCFCRYADDGNVYVKTRRAGERVFESIERFLWKRLRLWVNRDKSAVAHYPERSFLGFSFTRGRELKIRFSVKSLRRMKGQVKAITRRSRGVSFGQVIENLNTFLRGWMGYYRLVETHTVIRDLDSWIRRRLRCFMVKRWINSCHTRYKKLVAMGVNVKDALAMAASRKGPWALSNAKPLKVAMPNQFFADQGLLSLLHRYGTAVR